MGKFRVVSILLCSILILPAFVNSNDDSEMIFNPMTSRKAPPPLGVSQKQEQAYVINSDELRRIRLELMYPYYDSGFGKEDRGDFQYHIKDNSPQVNKALNFLLPFFGFGYNYTWVSIHGYLGFSDGPNLSPVYPLEFPIKDYPKVSDPSFIGPFYSKCKFGELNGDEIDSRPSGVYFRTELNLMTRTDKLGVQLRERLMWDIREGIVGSEWFEPRHAMIATWKNLTFGGGTIHARKTTNTFQAVIATDETRTYAIFNYQHLGWLTHTEAGGSSEDGTGGTPAFIGFNAGNGTRAFEYKPYSQTTKLPTIMSSGNVTGHPSRHIFRIDERILAGQCIGELYDMRSDLQQLTFAPESGNMLGGTIVNVTGPCFTPNQRITCRFNTIQVEATYVDRNRASCVMPPVYVVGYIDIFVVVDGSNDLHWKGKFLVETPFQAPELVSFNMDELLDIDPQQLTIKWDYKNLTIDRSASVSINLWGYRENSIIPELIFIDTLVDGTQNDGEYVVNPKEFQRKKTPWATGIEIGLVTVNLTNTNNPGGGFTPVIWSRPLPLAWYMWPQWESRRGRWSENLCEAWIVRDRLLKNFASDLPICPCNLEQALADKGRFLPDQNCDKDGKVSNCYLHEGAKHCVRSAMPTASGAGQQCCYDWYGYLMMTADQKWGGRPGRAHDLGNLPWNEANKVPSLSHYLHDVAPFLPCCLWQHEQSWWCMTFRFERRQSQNCVGYQPPAIASVFGDPHIYTFDGAQYTFNGKGEFQLVKVDTPRHKLDVQGRFEQIPKNHYGEVKATILTAVAARDNTSSTVEIRIRPRDAQWRYKLDVFVDRHRIFFDRFPQKIQTFHGVTVYTPTTIQNQSHVIAMFQSGAGVEVIENKGHMTCQVYLPMTFLNQTRGLFGNWSGLVEDDFVLPDGSLGPVGNTNNLNAMHTQFGMKWAIDTISTEGKGTSLFYHENGKTSSNYADRNFEPQYSTDPYTILPRNVTLKTNKVEEYCGDSYQCKYDYSVTLSEEFAHWSKFYQLQHIQLKENGLKDVISCGALMTPIHGRKSTFHYTPGTEVLFDCDPEFVLVGERRRVCEANGRWNLPNSGVDDRRTESEWKNWVPTKATRCIEEGEHDAVASAKTAGIVMGILIPLAIIAFFIFIVCRRRNTQNERPDGFNNADRGTTDKPVFNVRNRNSESMNINVPLMTTKDVVVVDEKPPKKENVVHVQKEPPPIVSELNNSPKSPRAINFDSDMPNKFDLDDDAGTASPRSSTLETSPDPSSPNNPTIIKADRNRKPIKYDAVYYTGEPLPNRPDVIFSEDRRDSEEYPPPPPLSPLGTLTSSPPSIIGSPPTHEVLPPSSAILKQNSEPYISATVFPLDNDLNGLEEGEHDSVSSAITSGIVLGILLPLIFIAFFAFRYYQSRKNEHTVNAADSAKNRKDIQLTRTMMDPTPEKSELPQIENPEKKESPTLRKETSA